MKINLKKHKLPIEGHCENDKWFEITEFVPNDEFPYKGEVTELNGCSAFKCEWDSTGNSKNCEFFGENNIETLERDNRNDKFLR